MIDMADFLKWLEPAKKEHKGLCVMAMHTLVKKSEEERVRWNRMVAAFIINDIAALLNDVKWDIKDAIEYRDIFVNEDVPKIIALRYYGLISAQLARKILRLCWDTFLDAERVCLQNKMLEDDMSDEVLDKIIVGVLDDNQKAVADYRRGKTQAVTALVGFVMKQTKGKADAAVVKQKLTERLSVRDEILDGIQEAT